jgi:Golgi phosphoprotein 3
MVNIFEALFILALDEEEGDIVESVLSTLESTLAGAVLTELVLQNRIELVDHRVNVTNQSPTGIPVLDKALFEIIDASKPRKLKYWINTLTYKKLLDEIAHQLIEKGVLVRKKKRLWLVSSSGDNGNNFSAKYGLKSRLREIVLAGQEPDLSENVLLAFLYDSDLLKLVYTHGERKAAHKRDKKLIANDEEGSGLGEALDEIVDEACESG